MAAVAVAPELGKKRTLPRFTRVPAPAPPPGPDVRIAEVYAAEHCDLCGGLGHRERNPNFCRCALLAIFRHALYRYRAFGARSYPTVRGMVYRCDFEIAARSVLQGLDAQVFRLFHLERATWRVCAQALSIDKAKVFSTAEGGAQDVARELLRREIFPIESYLDFGRQPTQPTTCLPDGPSGYWRATPVHFIKSFAFHPGGALHYGQQCGAKRAA